MFKQKIIFSIKIKVYFYRYLPLSRYMQRPLKNPYRSSTKYYHVKYLHANMSKNNHRGEPCKHVNISQITSRVPDSVLRWLSKTWGTVCKSWRETERKIRSLYSTDFSISWKYFQWKQVRYFQILTVVGDVCTF